MQHSVHDGIPVIEGTLAWVGCTLKEWIPGGDHTIGIGTVTAAEASHGRRAPGLVPRRVPVSDLHTCSAGSRSASTRSPPRSAASPGWRTANPKLFWITLRAGQVLVAVSVVIGAVLLLDGRDLPRLHLVYGLTPIAVAFLAEQLKLLATQTLLDKRGYEGGADVAQAAGGRAARVRDRGAAARAGRDGHLRVRRRRARGPRAALVVRVT